MNNVKKKHVANSFNKWLDDNHPTGKWVMYNFIRGLLAPLLTEKQDKILRQKLNLEENDG